MGNLSQSISNVADTINPSPLASDALNNLFGIQVGNSSLPTTGTPADANSDNSVPTVAPQTSVAAPDTWAPRHNSFIGKLADAYLQSYGMAPAFQQHVDEQNLQDAVGGFQSNPLQAISRLARIPGQEMNAIKLYQQYQASQSGEQAKEIQANAKKDLVYNRIGAMLQAATPETYPAMKAQVEKYVKNVWGMDPEDIGLPDTYDKAQISALTMGAIKPGDVMKEQGKNSREQVAIAQKQRQLDALVGYRAARLQQAQQDLKDKNARAAASLQALNDYRNRVHPQTRVVQTPNGEMELSPSGVTGRIGDQIWQKIAPGQWERIK